MQECIRKAAAVTVSTLALRDVLSTMNPKILAAEFD